MSNKTLEAIFSVKNNKEKTHKVITVLGTKIKIKRDDIEKFKEAYENYKIMHDPSLYIGIPDDITLQLMFNNDCNCRCKFCSANNQTRQTRQMISQDMLYKYLEPLYEKTKTIIPTYGEITHCKEGYEYLKWINEHYPHINFFIETNGIAFNKRWFELAAKSLMVVKFSVNAIDEETFKKTVWEKDRVFTTIKNNIENYIIYLQERGLSSFKPSISSVLNSTNYHIARDFVKMGINWNLQSFGFYFDHRENPLKNTYIKDKSGFDEALMTVLELEKLLKGKVYFYFRIFMPANLSEYEKKVEKISIESLQEKYADIWAIAKNFKDIKELYNERTQIRKKYGKKLLTYFEHVEGACWHKREYKGRMICENPWNHIRLYTDGMMEVCAWRPFKKVYNIKNYIKNDKLDFNLLFNDLHRRKLRKEYMSEKYEGCMKNCVSARPISKEEFDRKYGFEA